MDVRRKMEAIQLLNEAAERLQQVANTLLDEGFKGEATELIRLAQMIDTRRDFILDGL